MFQSQSWLWESLALYFLLLVICGLISRYWMRAWLLLRHKNSLRWNNRAWWIQWRHYGWLCEGSWKNEHFASRGGNFWWKGIYSDVLNGHWYGEKSDRVGFEGGRRGCFLLLERFAQFPRLNISTLKILRNLKMVEKSCTNCGFSVECGEFGLKIFYCILHARIFSSLAIL